MLFAADAQGRDPQEVLQVLQDHFSDDEEQTLKLGRVMKDFAGDLVSAVVRQREDIDTLISRLSHNWKLYRMNRVDLNILRMAIAEMASFPEIPGRVTLNEAVDLGKRYGAENSAAFINGILDKIHSLRDRSPNKHSLKEILAELDESVPTG